MPFTEAGPWRDDELVKVAAAVKRDGGANIDDLDGALPVRSGIACYAKWNRLSDEKKEQYIARSEALSANELSALAQEHQHRRRSYNDVGATGRGAVEKSSAPRRVTSSFIDPRPKKRPEPSSDDAPFTTSHRSPKRPTNRNSPMLDSFQPSEKRPRGRPRKHPRLSPTASEPLDRVASETLVEYQPNSGQRVNHWTSTMNRTLIKLFFQGKTPAEVAEALPERSENAITSHLGWLWKQGELTAGLPRSSSSQTSQRVPNSQLSTQTVTGVYTSGRDDGHRTGDRHASKTIEVVVPTTHLSRNGPETTRSPFTPSTDRSHAHSSRLNALSGNTAPTNSSLLRRNVTTHQPFPSSPSRPTAGHALAHGALSDSDPEVDAEDAAHAAEMEMLRKRLNKVQKKAQQAAEKKELLAEIERNIAAVGG